MTVLRIHGRIFRKEGMLVAEFDEIGQTTWAYKLDEILADVPRLVFEYIQGAHAAGILERELTRLGAASQGGSLEVNVHMDLSVGALPSQPLGSTSALDTHLSVPLAA